MRRRTIRRRAAAAGGERALRRRRARDGKHARAQSGQDDSDDDDEAIELADATGGDGDDDAERRVTGPAMGERASRRWITFRWVGSLAGGASLSAAGWRLAKLKDGRPVRGGDWLAGCGQGGQGRPQACVCATCHANNICLSCELYLLFPPLVCTGNKTGAKNKTGAIPRASLPCYILINRHHSL